MKNSGLIVLFLVTMSTVWGQNERKVIRQGLRAYNDGEFSEAEVQFRKAEDINQESFEAEFNTGTALYGQEKYEETVKQYESLVKQAESSEEGSPESLAHIWHNMGNSLLEAQQYAPSIEAYKNSLRLNPDDFDSKYNLAYAKQKLKEQEQQQEQQDQDQQGEDDQKQEDQQDQKDQSQDQEQKDQQDQKDQSQDQDQQEQKDQPQEQEQQAQPQEISKEDAERMLKAIQQQEKDVKDKVDKNKAAAAKVKTEKDW